MKHILILIYTFSYSLSLLAHGHIVTNLDYTKQLPKTIENNAFTFAIFGDRTGNRIKDLRYHLESKILAKSAFGFFSSFA